MGVERSTLYMKVWYEVEKVSGRLWAMTLADDPPKRLISFPVVQSHVAILRHFEADA